MASEKALTVSLEEFGLSIYEARAYVALITRGTVSASDLAFYSEIPRTKIYPTMKKLTSKNLAIVSHVKSIMMCTAVRPEDAFDSIIHDHIQKVTAMNSLVEDLKKAGEKSRRESDSEERRYTQIGTGSILAQMRSMIEGTKSSIMIMADRWGLGLLAECREHLLTAQRLEISIRCVMPYEQVCSEPHRALPGMIETRATHAVGSNHMIFDSSDVLMLDNTNGRGAVFPSSVTLGTSCASMFEIVWAGATETGSMTDMTTQEAQEACRMIRTINEGGLQYVLGEITGADNARRRAGAKDTSNDGQKKFHEHNTKDTKRTGPPIATKPDLYGMMEREGISVGKRPLYDIVCMFDSIMQSTCNGSANLEEGDKSITIKSARNGWALLPWVVTLEGLLQRRGHDVKVIHGADSSKNGEKAYIYLGKD